MLKRISILKKVFIASNLFLVWRFVRLLTRPTWTNFTVMIAMILICSLQGCDMDRMERQAREPLDYMEAKA
jgi:hypothetical protein